MPLYPDTAKWDYVITASVSTAVRPALVAHPVDDSVFFAVAAAGIFDTLPSLGSNTSIVLGQIRSDGTLGWMLRDAQLVSGVPDTAPSLVLGSSGELYVAFETTGNVPGRYNAADVPSFCGSCGATAGRSDLVLARVDGAVAGSPTVTWVSQDAFLNSCNNESAVQLHWDSTEERLYMAYVTSGATQCNLAVGGPNIVTACWHPEGYAIWTYQGTLLNGTGANAAPTIATDGTGAVYIAYTITAPVEGGGALQGTTDIEVVTLRPVGSPITIVRNWILSAQATVNAGSGASNTVPSLVCDASRGILYLAFVTTGTVPGGTKTATTSELVFAAVNTATGTLRWLLQSPTYNQPVYRYNAVVDRPQLALDKNGALYATAVALDTGGDQMVLVFRMNPGTQQSSWSYWTPAGTYNAYVPAATFATPKRFLTTTPSTDAYVALAAYNGRSLFMAINSVDDRTLNIICSDQSTTVFGQTAYEYMTTYRPEFSAQGYYSGGGNQGISGELSAPTNLSVVVTNGQLYLLFDPPVERTATGYTVTADPGALSVGGVSSPIAIPGITNGTPYTLTITATDGTLTSPPASIGPIDSTYTFTTTSFTTEGSTSWRAPPYVTSVEYLIVGGGGGSGGGFDTGAGGGGGGGMVRTGTTATVPGTTYTVVVGAGGTAGVSIRSPVSETNGGAGGDSSFDTVTALGGRGGYASRQNGGTSSAGGVAAVNPTTAATGGSGGGSAGDGNGAGGGGGGSSGNGTAGVANVRGSGGAGTTSSLSGSSVTYGRGGNGANGNTNTTGTVGTANTGDGAAAGGATSSSQRSGAVGGSGIVILKF